MSRDCCVALPRGAMGLSAVCDVVFPDHTHLLFIKFKKKWFLFYFSKDKRKYLFWTLLIFFIQMQWNFFFLVFKNIKYILLASIFA